MLIDLSEELSKPRSDINPSLMSTQQAYVDTISIGISNVDKMVVLLL
jgi:hypothetical protein